MVEESRKSEPLQENERTWAVYRGVIQFPQPKLKELLKEKNNNFERKTTCHIQGQKEQQEATSCGQNCTFTEQYKR